MLKRINLLLFLLFLIASCNLDKKTFIIQIENQYDTIDGKKQIVSQEIKTLRSVDSLPITILTKISNYKNDTRLKYLTGQSKENGLQDFLLDSIYYDKFGNDTLKKSFVRINNKWQQAQSFFKKFRTDNQIRYFMTERPFKKDYYSKREIFYLYNKKRQILTETETECSILNAGFSRCVCDSIFKTKYFYSQTGILDSTVSYMWLDDKWSKLKINRPIRTLQ